MGVNFSASSEWGGVCSNCVSSILSDTETNIFHNFVTCKWKRKQKTPARKGRVLQGEACGVWSGVVSRLPQPIPAR